MEIKVKIVNVTSQPTKVTTGLRQKDALSSMLFDLVLKKVIRKMDVLEGVTLSQSTIGHLPYANDIAFLGENIDMI